MRQPVESKVVRLRFDLDENRRFLRQLTVSGFTLDYYNEHKRAGLDYAVFGAWQQMYGRWIVQSLDPCSKRLLDIGCACGSTTRGLSEAGAIVQGIDVCEAMIQLGRQAWPELGPLLHVGDAVNLHMFPDSSFDGLHSSQVAEHWKPQLVPFILLELARVTIRGGLFFCALDTEELFARQSRTPEHDDPTHVCIKPMSWWHCQLADSGWEICTDEWTPVLKSHPESFLTSYDWDVFVARKPVG